MNILLIEDNKNIAETIFDYFELKGSTLDFAGNGLQGQQLAQQNTYDIIILDIMLPKANGFDVCNALREEGVDTPILMLTAKDRREDILHGFAQGADDYLVKPFDLDILEARIEALARRHKGNTSNKELQFGELSLELDTHQLIRQGKVHTLNPTQFSIMKLLLKNAPNVVKRQDVIDELWGDDEPDQDLLRSHIYKLRCLIDKPYEHAYIHTIPKIGYRLVNSVNTKEI